MSRSIILLAYRLTESSSAATLIATKNLASGPHAVGRLSSRSIWALELRGGRPWTLVWRHVGAAAFLCARNEVGAVFAEAHYGAIADKTSMAWASLVTRSLAASC